MSRLDAESVRQAAKGKWPSILAAAGIDGKYLTDRHGPCPICGGNDRFRFDDKDGKGTFYCNGCGAGDGFSLLQKALDMPFAEALRKVSELSGTAQPVRVRQGRDVKTVRDEMNALWRGAKPLEEVEATRLWWFRRLGSIPVTTELRAVRSLSCPGKGDWPGMVARIMDREGKPCSLHRTYLTNDGQKAPIDSPRRVMDISLPDGCAVRLQPVGEEMAVAEGIENAASCNVMFGLPTWALLNAQNMKKFIPPPGVRRVVIFGDCDSSFTGQASAFELARSLHAMRKRRDPELRVEVNVYGVVIDPSAWDRDWNDAHLAQRLNKEA
jgi:putative DNA primase/helicase